MLSLEPHVTTTVALALPIAEQVREICVRSGSTLKAFVANAVERELRRIQRAAARNGGATA
jgi:hypothetical protein